MSILVEEARDVEDLPLAKLSADKQVISGRKIEILQNQFKIEITDPSRMIGIYEVPFKPLSQGKFDKPLKREDNRNLIQNLSKTLGTNGLKYDGENLLISNQLLHKINHQDLRGARENEDVYVSVQLLHTLYIFDFRQRSSAPVKRSLGTAKSTSRKCTSSISRE